MALTLMAKLQNELHANMLKQRVITAVILVVILLAALFAPNPIFWRALITIAVLVAFWEWLRFCQISKPLSKMASYLLFGVCFYLLQLGQVVAVVLVPVACIVWLILLLFTMTDKLDFLHHPLVKLLIGVFVLNVAGWLLIEFKSVANGSLWLLCFMVSVWAADIGAYFAGRRYGKTKLAPKVSPGKTVEGLIGGLVLVAMIYVPVLFINFSVGSALLLLLTVLITALVSVGGDLFESKLKRYVGLKDSSQVLPGHGGVLDRVDSLLAGAPFFYLGLLLLGYYR